MHVAFHLGAHCTDEDRLVKCLVQNRSRLAEEGIAVPGPGTYRRLLRDAMHASDGTAATPEAEDALLHAILGDVTADRLVLSFENFLCVPAKVLKEGMLYPMAEARAHTYRALFPGQECSFFLALRNPATFLPALHALVGGDAETFLAGVAPQALRWSDTVAALRAGAPDAPITVWCDEDRPVIWPDVLRVVAASDPATELTGAFAALEEVVTEAGVQALRERLAADPPANAALRRRLAEDCLAHHARTEAVEMEVDLPGWTDATVTDLTDAYNADVKAIAGMPGVTLIAP